MVDMPVLHFKSEDIALEHVKAKVWREISKIKDIKEYTSTEDMIKFIANVYDNPKVTIERIENEIDLVQIFPLYLQIYGYVFGLVTAGLEVKKKEMAGQSQ